MPSSQQPPLNFTCRCEPHLVSSRAKRGDPLPASAVPARTLATTRPSIVVASPEGGAATPTPHLHSPPPPSPQHKPAVTVGKGKESPRPRSGIASSLRSSRRQLQVGWGSRGPGRSGRQFLSGDDRMRVSLAMTGQAAPVCQTRPSGGAAPQVPSRRPAHFCKHNPSGIIRETSSCLPLKELPNETSGQRQPRRFPP